MAEMEIAKIMREIPKHFNPEMAEGVSASVQCMFSGDQASDWVLEIKNQTCTIKEGKIEAPDISIKADTEDGIKILMQELDPMRAFTLGKVKVNGNLGLGMKLIKLFSL